MSSPLTTSLEWELDELDYPGRARPKGGEFGHTINGLHMHIEAYRVAVVDGLQEPWAPEFRQEVEALQSIAEGALVTTELPGLEGDWVIAAFPHGAN